MKKGLLAMVVALICAMTCVFGLVACDSGNSGNSGNNENGNGGTDNNSPPQHTHTYSEEWSYDETYHWHSATCEHKNEVSDKEEHEFVNYVCTVCGYTAVEPTEGLSFRLFSSEYAVTGIGSCTDTDIIIPAVYNNLPVTSISTNAFWNNEFDDSKFSLTSVIIPDSITSIGIMAFCECDELTKVVIGNGVTIIGTSAFNQCTALTNITIPNSVTKIQAAAFQQCTSLASITIGSGITSIGEGSFSSCRSLTNISFNGTMEQWNAIEKNKDWDSNTGNYTVYCTDGEITKD